MTDNSDPKAIEQLVNAGRRAVLGAGAGIGAVAAAEIMGSRAFGKDAGAPPTPDQGPDKGSLLTGQIPAKVNRVISMHMWGAMSQVDTFDYKPGLEKWHGKEIPDSVKGTAKISAMSNAQSSFPVMKNIAPFRQYGQGGHWVSDLMPHTGKISDDLVYLHSMHTEHVNHDPAAIFMHTGFQLAGRPAAGSWVHYALGTDNANLPSYIVMKSQFMSAGVGANSGAWSSGFLPSHHQGVEFRAGKDPVLYVSNPDGIDKSTRRRELDFIGQLSNADYANSGDPEILSKMSQYEMAYRMQDSVPEIADITNEPDYILDMYGPQVRIPGTFARNCLLTRRLMERGVKFVQLMQVGWDHHTRLAERHPAECWAVDQASSGLVADLKQRGLLDDTLVMFGGEFGRTVYAQGGINPDCGRDHHGGNFTMWLAGGGLKAGTHYGQTDDFSYNVVKDPINMHDLHATMLYLMGIDHKQLTYHYQGRDFRLTDVSGDVIKGILA